MSEVNDWLEDKYPILWNGVRMRVEFGTYAMDNSTSISLMYWDEDMNMEAPYAVATVYAEGVELEEDEVVIKDYSENEGILKMLIDNKIVNKSHAKVPLGFAEGHICQLVK